MRILYRHSYLGKIPLDVAKKAKVDRGNKKKKVEIFKWKTSH